MPDLITVDYETFFDSKNGYSLSKRDVTTESYIRDPRFQIIMVGVKVGDQDPAWFSGTQDETREFLGDMGYEDAYVVHHNAHFDAAISAWVLGLKPKFIFDTLSMARPIWGARELLALKNLCRLYQLGEKGDDTRWADGLRREDFSQAQLQEYAGYCATRPDSDCNLTHRLFHKLLPETTKSELLIIDSTVRMFSEPQLHLDLGILETHLASVRKKQAELLAKVGGEDARKALRSNPKFATLLEERGVAPPKKISPTTGKETFAFAKTDKAMTDLLNHADPEVQALVAARMGVKSTIEETRTQRLIEIGRRGLFPVPIQYAGAVTTLRDSGTDKINTQNFGRKSPIRAAIKAGPGQVMVVGDLSQIELRVNHTLAGNIGKIDLFIAGEDVYIASAMETFGCSREEVDKPRRFVGKVKELQLGYQSGAAKYADTARLWSGGEIIIPPEEAKRHVAQWRATNKAVVDNNWTTCHKALSAMCFDLGVCYVGADGKYAPTRLIETYNDGKECGFLLPSGHKIRYYDLQYDTEERRFTYHTRNGRRDIYGGKATENCVQAVSRHVFMHCAMTFRLILERHFPRWHPHPVMRVHDEIAVVGPKSEAQHVANVLTECMSSPLGNPKWWPDLPIASEVEWGESYGDAK